MILIPLKKLDGNRACLVCFREATNQIAQPSLEIVPSLVEPPAQNNVEVPWVGDDVEYVVLDDEDHFKPLLSDSSDYVHIAWSNVECVGLEDDLVMDDALGCETFIHAIDLENPTIAVVITFGDGDTFTEAIRQYAIKGEYEIAAPYSDSTRYRGYCKDARCKWWIHALQLQDGRTWRYLIHTLVKAHE